MQVSSRASRSGPGSLGILCRVVAVITITLVAMSAVENPVRAASFQRGECNQTGPVDIADVIYLLDILFVNVQGPLCADALRLLMCAACRVWAKAIWGRTPRASPISSTAFNEKTETALLLGSVRSSRTSVWVRFEVLPKKILAVDRRPGC